MRFNSPLHLKFKLFKMKMISTKEYAAARGITVQAVCQAIKNGHQLPYVLKVGKFSNRHVLYVNSDFPDGIEKGRPNKYKIKKIRFI